MRPEPDHLTSRTLAVARLVFLCATDGTLGRRARHQLTLLLLRLVSGAAGATAAIEPPFGTLLAQLRAGGLPAEFVQRFEREMRGGAFELEDVWNLVADLFALTQPSPDPDAPAGAPPVPPKVERSSVFGLYARRVRVAFECASFEETCSVTSRLRSWLGDADAPEAGPQPPASCTAGGEPTGLAAASATAAAVPSWAHLLPASQLDHLLHERCVAMETGLPFAADLLPMGGAGGAATQLPPMPPPPLAAKGFGASDNLAAAAAADVLSGERGAGDGGWAEAQMVACVRGLELFAPDAPQVAHLQTIYHTQARDLPSALEAFHRYYDSARASSAGLAPNSGGGAPGGIGTGGGAAGAAANHSDAAGGGNGGGNGGGGGGGAGGGGGGGVGFARREVRRSAIQWADLNLARLLLSFGMREQALAALHEAVRLAQQNDDHACLAHALLWLAHAHDGIGANVWGQVSLRQPRDTLRRESTQASLLERCLARAHELRLPELAALASESLALRLSLEAGIAPESAAPGAVSSGRAAAAAMPGAGQRPAGAALRAPCLPPASVGGLAARPTLLKSLPPPLRTWEALRCGSDGVGACTQLVRSCAWERFGDTRLAQLHASLQLRLYRPAALGGVAPHPPQPNSQPSSHLGPQPAAHLSSHPASHLGSHLGGSLGPNGAMPTQHDRLLAACKLAAHAFRTQVRPPLPRANIHTYIHINTYIYIYIYICIYIYKIYI